MPLYNKRGIAWMKLGENHSTETKRVYNAVRFLIQERILG
jgi:hypothetical protein